MFVCLLELVDVGEVIVVTLVAELVLVVTVAKDQKSIRQQRSPTNLRSPRKYAL